MSRTIRPVGSNVLVCEGEAKTVTPGGIVLPDQVKEANGAGKVIAVGPKVEEVLNGDLVMYAAYNATPVCVDGSDWVVIPEENIFLTIRE